MNRGRRTIPRGRPRAVKAMDTSSGTLFLDPGAAHPEPPLGHDEGAERFGVTLQTMQRWLDAGLPTLSDGTLDPFVVGDWVADHRLAEAPVLARRWRGFLAWFVPHALGQDSVRHLEVQRRHRLFLPPGLSSEVLWYLPRLTSWRGQRVERDEIPGAESTSTHHCLVGASTVSGTATVVVSPVQGLTEDLLPVVEELIGDFRYTYRRHQPREEISPEQRFAGGSCADLTLALGERLSDMGRPWRLVSGVIAGSTVANPHFWMEVAGPEGVWLPVDPTIPCLARRFPVLLEQLGGGDWRNWVRAWTGSLDARRVTLLRGESPVARLPGGSTGGSLIGEAVVDGKNAWNCLDWVCGPCSWEFSPG